MNKRFITICLCALIALWQLTPAMTALADDTGTSEATISFTALPSVFSISTLSPSGNINAMDLTFTGDLPDTPDDSFHAALDPRWIKVTDTTDINSWNVTVQMTSFVDGAQIDTFNARVVLSGIESYRQIADDIADDGTGLSNSDPSWPAVDLGSNNAITLISAGGSITFAEAKDLGRGHYFFKFPGAGILLDQIDPISKKVLEAGVNYTAALTWTGTPQVDN